MSEFKKMFVLVDAHGVIFSNGAELSQQFAAERLSVRVEKGNLKSIVVTHRSKPAGRGDITGFTITEETGYANAFAPATQAA
ncbi:hypothetical protein MZD04_gp254 [Pseudomonas phage Psa21]|uniref:Uncharacterized protein n=1 Tax=Pseudomonas phage Psa21 TaxID=2530023 RepID=A0A481W4Q3_9CAUD|nr:hypothetical protein MZD04_gp254 [Pseudomonas phage Psa21]QBJ02780.1 hypothetical protein PSA21_254 [Pseudomonas phage Psa21]